MSGTGLDVFDKTVQTSNLWLEEIVSRIGPDRRVAWHVLGAVLRTLRDQLPIGLAAHLGAQLPLLVRGLYYDRWHPQARHRRLRSAKAFIDEVAMGLEDTRPVNTEAAIRSVFQVLNHYVDPEQIANVRDALAKPIRRLWPESATDLDVQATDQSERSLERT